MAYQITIVTFKQTDFFFLSLTEFSVLLLLLHAGSFPPLVFFPPFLCMFNISPSSLSLLFAVKYLSTSTLTQHQCSLVELRGVRISKPFYVTQSCRAVQELPMDVFITRCKAEQGHRTQLQRDRHASSMLCLWRNIQVTALAI